MAVIIALDVGTKTIGIAQAQATGPAFARYPEAVCTVYRKGLKKDIPKILLATRREDVSAFVVGLPLQLDGTEGRSVRLARQVGDAIAAATGKPVHYQDERFSSVDAAARLREAGVRLTRAKQIIDQEAAVVILRDWIREHQD